MCGGNSDLLEVVHWVTEAGLCGPKPMPTQTSSQVNFVVSMAPGDHLDMDDNDPLFTQNWPLQGAGTPVAGWWGFALGGCFSGLKCYEVSDVGGYEVDYN